MVAAIAATDLMSLEKVHATRENEITQWLDKQEQKNILYTEQCVYFSGTAVISSSGCFLLVLRIPFKCQNMYLYLHFVSVPRFCVGLTLLWPFFSPSLCPALLVPGYRQVSGRRKDLFCLFWISCFCWLPREGVGWLHHSPLSTTDLTTLMWPRSASLLCPAKGLFLHCVV